jgi:hypothetical protein
MTVSKNVGLLLQASEMFREIAKYLRKHGATRDSKHFYSSVMAHCLMIHDHISRIKDFIGDDNTLVTGILLRLEATVSVKILETRLEAPTTGFPRLAILSDRWSRTQREGNLMDLKRITQLVGLAGDLGQQEELIEFFENWEDDIKSQYPDDPSLWTREDMPSRVKTRGDPSYVVLNASQSLFQALVESKDCTCQPMHDFNVRLCLGTFRSSRKIEKERDHDCGFDIFLSNMQEQWHEADVCFAKSAGIRFGQTEKAAHGSKIPAMKIKNLCEPIKKRQPFDRLKLRVGEDGRLWKLRSEKCSFAVDEAKEPVSLQTFIQDQHRSLTDKTKRILAVMLGYAVLYLHETPWLTPSWSPSNILFFHTTSSAIPLKPFLQTELAMNVKVPSRSNPVSDPHNFDPDNFDPDDFDPDDLDTNDLDPDDIMIHQCPHLVTLGIVLMELYLTMPFEQLAEKYGVLLNDRTRSIDAELVFEQCKNEIPENSQFHYAVKKCLDPKVWEDSNGTRLSDHTLKSTIYHEIVGPLEDELNQAFSHIPLDQLDSIAQSLDLASWGQAIQNHPAPTHSSEISVQIPFTQSNRPLSSHDHLMDQYQQQRSASPSLQGFVASPTMPHVHPISSMMAAPQPGSLIPFQYASMAFFDDETISEGHSAEA